MAEIKPQTALIVELRREAGRSGTEEILKLLREFDPYSVEDSLSLPMPMFFDDAWREVLDLLIAEAFKA